TLSLATASYHLLEMPFRRGAFRRWRASWTLAPVGAATLAVAAVLATVGGQSTMSLLASSQLMSPLAPTEASASEVQSLGQGEGNGLVCLAPVRVLVVGDSVAWSLGLGLERAQSTWNMLVQNSGVLGCGILRADAKLFEGQWVEQSDTCDELLSLWQEAVDSFRPDVVVVLVGAWDTYDLKIGGRVIEFGTAEADDYARGQLNADVDVLSSGGAKVILLTTPYPGRRDLGIDVGNNRVDPGRVDRLNSLYQEIVDTRQNQVSLVDLNRFLGPATENGDVMDGVSMRSDELHFTPEGADLITGWLAPEIEQAVR
ncbi:MAG: SGNH hydrolase domain-containing protein, partial [Dehalococcoidia bacterium]